MKILGKKPSESASTPGETSVFRKRPFTVETNEAEDNAEPQALPDLQTQLERGARFRQKLFQMKVHGNRPVVEPKLAHYQLQTQSEHGPKFVQRHEPMPAAFNHQQLGQQFEEAPVPAQAESPQVQRQAEEEQAIPRMQAKLVIGAPGDKYEQEADRVAEQVMSMAPSTAPNIQRQTQEKTENLQTKPLVETITPLVQRHTDGVPQVQPDLESRLNVSQGGGSPLPEEVQSFMEPRFGADFSGVRVHTGSEAVQMNRELNAQAFTHKQDVYFGAGKSPAKDALTAHELTHVVQQVGSSTALSGQQSLSDRMPIQRDPKDTEKTANKSLKQQIIDALNKPDPVAGVGDYAEAFRILNGLAMYEILNTLTWLKGSGHFDNLNANLNRAVGVNSPRLQVAFKAVQSKEAVTAESFAAEQENLLSTLPSEQRTDIAKFLDPQWVALLPIEDLPGASDEQLGIEYGHALQGDPTRLQAIESEIENRLERSSGIGFSPLTGGSASTPGTTAVTPDVALKILENLSKGEPPFRPELGKGGASWFLTKGNPFVGVDADKNVNIEVELKNLKDAIVFTEKELLSIFEEIKQDPEVIKAAEVAFREKSKVPTNLPLSNRLQKAFNRKHGFLDKFAEAKMWDKVGEKVAKSPGKAGKVILQNSWFSKSGDGEFTVVADPAKIQIKGGPTKLLETVSKAGVEAAPVVVEAAEALAKNMKWAGRVRNVFRYGGRIMIVVAIAADVYKIYKATDRVKATIESVGGWAGATAAGAAFAAWWTPADVAGPWAWLGHGVGTLVTGAIGYWVGSEVTRTIYELVVEE